jgi:CheY-like chemotaxis protein
MKMNVELYRKVRILVAGDSEEELQAIQRLLNEDGFVTIVNTQEAEAIEIFRLKKPVVVILTYFDADQAERFYTKLHRSCKEIDAIPHRTLLLCRGVQAQRGFQLCLDGVMDDYVVSRPLIDPYHLRLSVYQALNNCSAYEELKFLREKTGDAGCELDNMDSYATDAFSAGTVQDNDAIQAFAQSASKLTGEFNALGEKFVKGAGGSPPLKTLPDEQLRQVFDAFMRESLNLMLQTWKKQLESVAQWRQGFETSYQDRMNPLRSICATRFQNKPLVMVAEKNPQERLALRALLEEDAGCRVVEAENVGQALGLLKAERPNLIFMDLMSPGMGGLEMLKRIKENPFWRVIPLIVITGVSDKEIVKECIRLGALDFIVKPSNKNIILQKIENHLRSRGGA